MKGLMVLGGLICMMDVLAGIAALVVIALNSRMEFLWLLIAGIIASCGGGYLLRRAITNWQKSDASHE